MHEGTIKSRWESEHGETQSLINRCEEYAAWTIPHIFPQKGVEDTEQQNSANGTGAEVTNFLANKLTSTLFSPHSPYFRLMMEEELLAKALDAKIPEQAIEQSLAKAEKQVVKEQETIKGLRTSGSLVSKLLIVTGNALPYYNVKGKPIKVYSIRNYVVKRDGDGMVYKIITRDMKDYGTLPKKVKQALPDSYKHGKKDDHPVELLTEIRRKRDKDGDMTKRWEVQQGIDEFDLKTSGNYTDDKLPWIPLVWHLNPGDQYGRGLVEDYAGDFHALTELSHALVKGQAILADIKFLVRPGAATDVEEYNEGEIGSYHYGKEGDITSPQVNKGADFQLIEQAIEKYERRIGRAFLMGSSNRRQAERVTAEEIRMDAQDLETSKGGLYSRMVMEWQTKYAKLGLADIDFDLGKDFDVQIVAGMDTLSRAGDMDNFRWMLDDLAATQNIPEDIRAAVDSTMLMSFIASNRGVDHTKFTKSPDQVAQEQAQAKQEAMDQEMQLKAADTAGAMAVQDNGQQQQ